MATQAQKMGDTRKAVFATNFSLLNSTVVLKVRDGSGNMVSTDGNVTIEDHEGGIVSWDHGGTLAAGVYEAELWITRDGELYKAPSTGFAEVIITPDLS